MDGSRDQGGFLTPMRGLVAVLLVLGALILGLFLWRRTRSATPPAEPPMHEDVSPLPVSGGVATAPTDTVPPPPPSPAPVAAPLTAAEALSKGESLSKGGKADEALPLLERALEADPVGSTGQKAAGLLAGLHEAKGHPRKALGFRLRSNLSAKERAEAEVKTKEIAAQALGATPSPDDLVVTVGAGDTLGAIAKRHGTTVECLQRINGILDPARIRLGQKIKVVQGTWRVLVEKSAFRLTLFLDNVPVRTYAVGIGTEKKTPAASFVVEEKIPSPNWYPPGKPVVPFGSPENPLGTRWLGFKPTAEFSGLGIHGTAKDASIGTASSNGCVRMHNAEVEELFDFVPRGTVVEIKD